MTADAGGPVMLVKSRANSPLDDAIARMNKMRAMAEQSPRRCGRGTE